MSQMRAGLFLGEKNVRMQTLEKPVLSQGQALVKVSYAGICGTDMMIYFGKHPRAKAPLAMGHEFSGVVVESHENTVFAAGDRVVIEPTLSCGVCSACTSGQPQVCRTLQLIGIDRHGGFAEYVAVPLTRLHRIPEGLSDAHAAVAEPLAVALHTVRRSNLKVGDHVAILGGGPIGLIVGLVARQSGAGEVMVSDVSPYRLRKAKELGFTVLDATQVNVVDQVVTRTGGVGADIVFEVAGSQDTVNQTVELVKIQGQVVVVSVFKKSPCLDLAAMHFKELSLTTTRCYGLGDFQRAIRLLADGLIDVACLISHTLPLERIAEAFQLMENPTESLKVLLQP